MAKTSITTSNALCNKLISEKLHRDSVKESYWNKFMGEGSNVAVQVKSDLMKTKGDRITYGIRMRLSGTGVTEGTPLEGNEEALTTNSSTVTLQQYRHAVRDAGAMDRQRSVFNLSQESKDALVDWGSEKIDQLAFDAITASPTIYFSRQSGENSKGTSDPSASVTATDILTPSLISFIKVYCMTGGNRSQVPFRPIKINGKKYFVLLVHPDVMFDLKNDSTYAQAVREAQLRGKENPLFTGAAGIWDNVVVHEHENIDLTTTWGGAAVSGAKCTFFGAQALTWAWGKKKQIVEKKFDYDDEMGFGWGMIAGVAKPVFDSLDYGSAAVYVARTKISDL